ncbi:hypothetical protein ACMFMF_009334 [Clarireedia jacksonii]
MIGVDGPYYTSTTTLSYLLSSTQHEAINTPPPELRRDAPNPQSGAGNCAQAEQSASQASQQAFQQASDSIRQATQQASQQVQQASQSAANAIQQAQNSASQSISAMSRSSSSIASSASSAMSSIQASASSAIARANGAMSSAQFSASLSQQEASRAISQAGATAAAANEQARESQVSAITATQASLAIVGSIIASTLLTSLIFFLVMRYQKKSKRSRPPSSPGRMQKIYPSDPKSPGSDRSSSTTSYSQKKDKPRRQSSKLSEVSYPGISTTLGNTAEARKPEPIPRVKETSILWNPRNPPKAPTLRSWLKLQDNVSPFGPLKLPIDENAKGPLGGQLKSPLRSIDRASSPKFTKPPTRSPKTPPLEPLSPVESKARSTVNVHSTTTYEDDHAQSTLVGQAITNRESQATIWTDEVPSTYHVTTPTKYQRTPKSTTRPFEMDFPIPDRPARSTAEWLMDQQETNQSPVLLRPSVIAWRASGATSSPSMGLPQNPRIGFPVSIKSMKGEVQFVNGTSRMAGPELEVMGGDSLRVSAVGKAM